MAKFMCNKKGEKIGIRKYDFRECKKANISS